MKKGAGGKSVEDARDLAEDLGAIGRVGDDMIMQQRFGGQQDGKFAQWMMNQFFTRTGLHQFTEATRVASTRIGQVFLRRLAMDVRSEEHTSELQSLMRISYAVFCWKKKNIMIEKQITCQD